MLKYIRVHTGLLTLAVLFCTISAYGQGQNSPKIPVTTTVTVLGPKFSAPPPLTKQDILVYSRKTRLDVINWVPAQGERAPLQLAIVIDNSANQLGVGSQLNDIAGFVSLQSKSTSVGRLLRGQRNRSDSVKFHDGSRRRGESAPIALRSASGRFSQRVPFGERSSKE